MSVRTEKRTETACELIDKSLLHALVLAEEAEQEAMTCLAEAFPKGRPVKWSHGNNIRTGVVEATPNRNRTMHCADILVRSDVSGKVYRVTAGEVIRTTIGEWRD